MKANTLSHVNVFVISLLGEKDDLFEVFRQGHLLDSYDLQFLLDDRNSKPLLYEQMLEIRTKLQLPLIKVPKVNNL